MANTPPTAEAAYVTNFKRLADLEDYVGKELGLTDWMPITQARINTFAQATDDHQWIHVNPEKAKLYSPYKSTVAHGFLILSLATKFCYDTYSIDDVTMGINYGLDKVRFSKAAVAGSLLRGRVELMSYYKIRGGARIKLKIRFELKGERKAACVAEMIGQCYADPNFK